MVSILEQLLGTDTNAPLTAEQWADMQWSALMCHGILPGNATKPSWFATPVDVAMHAAAAQSLQRVKVLEEAVRWALGEGDSDFGDGVPETAQRYWWRHHLRSKAFPASQPQGADYTGPERRKRVRGA